MNDEMVLSELGEIAFREWVKLSERFRHVELDVFQIMPDHVHGILNVSGTLAVTPQMATLALAPHANLAVAPDSMTTAVIPHAPLPVAPDSMTTAVAPHAPLPVAPHATTPHPSATSHDQTPRPHDVTVGNIIGAYKSIVFNACLEIYKAKNKTMGKLWQRNYYESIIRNELAYQRISNYIINNPKNWKGVKYYY